MSEPLPHMPPAPPASSKKRIKPAGRHWTDTAAIILLLFGGFVLLVGWFVGVVLLWTSEAWKIRDKIIGTLIVPGGLLGSLLFISTPTRIEGCSEEIGSGVNTCVTDPSGIPSWLGATIVWLILLAPIATAIYLGMRLRQANLAASS
jgi:hypothetical protein